jgi:archaemetzincin
MKTIFIPLFFVIPSWFYLQPKVVYIQPLGDVKQSYIDTIKQSVEYFYGFKCVVKLSVPLTNELLAKSGCRYDASKILRKFKSFNNILIVTEKDIATKKDKINEWGVLGLGYRPGKTCVISTFRMKKNVNEEKIIDRLKKVSLHEVGHNLGLDHCNKDSKCMMNDAKGTIKTIDKEKIYLCPNCKKIIGIK